MFHSEYDLIHKIIMAAARGCKSTHSCGRSEPSVHVSWIRDCRVGAQLKTLELELLAVSSVSNTSAKKVGLLHNWWQRTARNERLKMNGEKTSVSLNQLSQYLLLQLSDWVLPLYPNRLSKPKNWPLIASVLKINLSTVDLWNSELE